MAGEIIASIITLLIFTGAVIAPFVYLFFMQKRERARRSREEAEAARSEGEVGQLDLSYREQEAREYGEGYYESHYSGEGPYYSRAEGHRVENRPSRSERAGRETYRVPDRESGSEKSGDREGLMSHIEDFSSGSLSSSLKQRYEGWDEMGEEVDTRSRSSVAKGLQRRVGSSWVSAGSTGISSYAGSRTRISRTGKGGLPRIWSLPDLQRGVLMAELLGPPKALEQERGKIGPFGYQRNQQQQEV